MLRQLKQTASEAMRHYSTNITASRLHPSLATAQNYPSRGVISMRGVPASANVFPLAESLLRHGPTFRTRLRCSTRIHFDHPNARTLSVVLQDRQKAGPSSIRHRTSEPAVPKHPSDVQAFHRDRAIAARQSIRNLMVLVAPGVPHFGVKPCHDLALLPPRGGPFLLPTQRTLLNPELGKKRLKGLERRFSVAIASRQKLLNSKVNSNSGQNTLRYRHVEKFTTDNHIPLSSFPFNGGCLGLPFYRPMQVDSHHPDMLEPEFVPDDTGTICNTRIREAVEMVTPFESRITGRFTRFHAPEKRAKRLVETTHCGLGTGEVQLGKPRVDIPLSFEPRRLLRIADGLLGGFIGSLPLLKADIVQLAMRFQSDSKFSRLIGIWFQPVLERLEHLFYGALWAGCDMCSKFANRKNLAAPATWHVDRWTATRMFGLLHAFSMRHKLVLVNIYYGKT
jgi:hypothetical protein